MKTVRQVLGSKGHTVFTIGPDAKVYEALQQMATHDVGALVVTEEGEVVGVLSERLDPLKLGAALQESGATMGPPPDLSSDALEARTLWVLLVINATMFVVEVVAAWLAESAGLLGHW